MVKLIFRLSVLGLSAVVIIGLALYFWDMHKAYARIRGKSTVITSSFGEIEYATGGTGIDVLVIHGSGGGYDQGQVMVKAGLGDQFHWITPSRFGYLRSTFHEGATFDDQAHAYAYLLDHLGVKKVAVVALSHGGPSALLFAVLHPDRISSLSLISCGVASVSTSDQGEANQKGDMLTAIFQHDLPYWLTTTLFRKQFIRLMGAHDKDIIGMNNEQRELVDHIIEYMNPVSQRAGGVRFDNKAQLPNERIAAITAPTVIFHATDDTLQLYHNAEFAASTIPNAQLMRFERGGHLLLAVERDAIRTRLQQHIRDTWKE